MKRILIDPGHGGTDPGAVGNGLREKDINLAVCLELASLLKNRGVEAILTRGSDVTLALRARTDLALQHKVMAVISVHHNAGGGQGIETYRSLFNAENARLGNLIHGELLKAFPEMVNRGAKTRRHPTTPTWDYYHMIREPHRQAGIPAIITECGFVDNSADAAIMKRPNFAKTQAEALTRGICAFFGVAWERAPQIVVNSSGDNKEVDQLKAQIESLRREREQLSAELGIAGGKIADAVKVLTR